MWHPLNESEIRKRVSEIQPKRLISPVFESLIGSLALTALIYCISLVDPYFGCYTAKFKHHQEINWQNISPASLFVMFIGGTIGYYYLVANQRGAPKEAYICFDCQEPFAPANICPKCGSRRIADLRLAEWIEEAPGSTERTNKKNKANKKRI
jgi:DNA-directed RNA polymerase subunit RPC12/RpoP